MSKWQRERERGGREIEEIEVSERVREDVPHRHTTQAKHKELFRRTIPNTREKTPEAR